MCNLQGEIVRSGRSVQAVARFTPEANGARIAFVKLAGGRGWVPVGNPSVRAWPLHDILYATFF